MFLVKEKKTRCRSQNAVCLRRAFFHRMDNEEYGCAIPRVIPAKRKESASAIRPGVCGVLRLLPKVHCRKLTVTVQLPANATSISNHFRFISRFKPEGGTILPSRPDIFGVSFPSYSHAAFFLPTVLVFKPDHCLSVWQMGTGSGSGGSTKTGVGKHLGIPPH